MVQAPQTTFPVVGGPVSHPDELKIACPRPIYPPPKWIGTIEWEDDEDEETSEGDEVRSEMTSCSTDSDIDWEAEFDEEFYITPRFLTSSSISPDAENLPSPFFPPSRDSSPSPDPFASLSPDAGDLPQPYFDCDPPVFAANSPPTVRGTEAVPRPSPWPGVLEIIVSPDPEDLPLPCFGVRAQLGVGSFEHLGDPDFCHNRVVEKGGPDHIWDRGIVCGRIFRLGAGG